MGHDDEAHGPRCASAGLYSKSTPVIVTGASTTPSIAVRVLDVDSGEVVSLLEGHSTM